MSKLCYFYILSATLLSAVILLTYPIFQGDFGRRVFNPTLYIWLVPLIVSLYLFLFFLVIKAVKGKSYFFINVSLSVIIILFSVFSYIGFIFQYYGEWYKVSKCDNFNIMVNYGSAQASSKVLISDNNLFFEHLGYETQLVPLSNPQQLSINKDNLFLQTDQFKKIKSCYVYQVDIY